MPFRRITFRALKKLRPLLKSKLPSTAMVLNIVDMTLAGKYPDGHLVEFYGFNGIPKEPENLFLELLVHPKHQELPSSVFYAPENPTDDMLEAFTDHHDWTKPHLMEYVNDPLASQLVKTVINKGGGLVFYPTAVLYMPIEDALRIDTQSSPKNAELNKEFEIDMLTPDHAEKINSYWKYGFEGGDLMLKESLKTMGGVGLFRKAIKNSLIGPRSPENMVGWVTMQHIGTLGSLHTLDEYRGRGLAKFAMEAGSRWIAQEGFIPLVQVEDYNVPSLKVMEAIGYKFIRNVYWVEYVPLH